MFAGIPSVRSLSVLSGGILMKLGINIHHVSGIIAGQVFKVRGQRSRS